MVINSVTQGEQFYNNLKTARGSRHCNWGPNTSTGVYRVPRKFQIHQASIVQQVHTTSCRHPKVSGLELSFIATLAVEGGYRYHPRSRMMETKL